MKKIFLMFLFNLLIAMPVFALYGHFAEFDTPKEEQKINLVIPAGSFFRGILGQTVSSEYINYEDKIKILIPSDFTIENYIVIPKNSLFIGSISSVGKAQRGLDGYFSIDIIGLVFPDGRQFVAKGYVSFGKNSKLYGGGFSRRAGHKSSLHRAGANGPKGVLMLQQDGPRMFGKEAKLIMGELVNVVLLEEIKID